MNGNTAIASIPAPALGINPLLVAGESVPTINARELQTFLESKRDFSTWISARIKKYGFEEGVDYVKKKVNDSGFPQTGEVESLNISEEHSRVRVDYHLTLDMAKELSMVERTEKGREARRYFIECERRLKVATDGVALPPPAIDLSKLTPSKPKDRAALSTLCRTYAVVAHPANTPSQADYRSAFKMVSSNFGLSSTTEFPVELIPDAIAFVQSKIDAIHQGKADAPALPTTEDTKAAIEAQRKDWLPILDASQKSAWAAQGDIRALAQRVRKLAHETDGNCVAITGNLAQSASDMLHHKAEALCAGVEEMVALVNMCFGAIATNLQLKHAHKALRDVRRALPA